MEYYLDAVHPVLRRVVEINLTEEQLKELISDLKKYGYEEKNMIIKKMNNKE